MLLRSLLLSDVIYSCGFNDFYMLMTFFSISKPDLSAHVRDIPEFSTSTQTCPELGSSTPFPLPSVPQCSSLTNLSSSKKEYIPCSLLLLGFCVFCILCLKCPSLTCLIPVPPSPQRYLLWESLPDTPNHKYSPLCLFFFLKV